MAEGLRVLGTRLGETWRRVLRSWRTSLQVRVVTSVMVVSVLVVGMLGFALVSIVAQRLLDEKFNVANEEIDRARVLVEQAIAASGADGTQAKLNAGREAMAERETGTSNSSSTVYEVVLIAPGTDGEAVRSPVDGYVPTQLRPFIQQGQISYQYATMDGRDGSNYSALVIGTPTASDVPGLELYLSLIHI